MSDECTRMLTQLIAPLTQPGQPLQARWLGDAEDPLPQQIAAKTEGLVWEETRADNRWPLAVMDARRDRPASSELAWWRDLGAAQLFVLLQQSAGFESALISLGLRPVARGPHHGVWAFDIADYKPRPDWLNPRFWANPDRWEQARW